MAKTKNKHSFNRKKVEKYVVALKKGAKFTASQLVKKCDLPSVEIAHYLQDIDRVKITGYLPPCHTAEWEVIA